MATSFAMCALNASSASLHMIPEIVQVLRARFNHFVPPQVIPVIALEGVQP